MKRSSRDEVRAVVTDFLHDMQDIMKHMGCRIPDDKFQGYAIHLIERLEPLVEFKEKEVEDAQQY